MQLSNIENIMHFSFVNATSSEESGNLGNPSALQCVGYTVYHRYRLTTRLPIFGVEQLLVMECPTWVQR